MISLHRAHKQCFGLDISLDLGVNTIISISV